MHALSNLPWRSVCMSDIKTFSFKTLPFLWASSPSWDVYILLAHPQRKGPSLGILQGQSQDAHPSGCFLFLPIPHNFNQHKCFARHPLSPQTVTGPSICVWDLILVNRNQSHCTVWMSPAQVRVSPRETVQGQKCKADLISTGVSVSFLCQHG